MGQVTIRRLLVVTAAVFFAATAVGNACSRTVPADAARALVPETGINHSLLNRAILAEVNYHRCRAGLNTLADGGQLLTAEAATHSAWMAKKRKLVHFNNIPGRETPGQRVKSAGIVYRSAAENLVSVHRYQIDNRRFKTVNRRQCQFAHKGKLVRAHSYASLARFAVDVWMKSPGHRKNILNTKSKVSTVGVVFADDRKYCGSFWMTQKLVG